MASLGARKGLGWVTWVAGLAAAADNERGASLTAVYVRERFSLALVSVFVRFFSDNTEGQTDLDCGRRNGCLFDECVC